MNQFKKVVSKKHIYLMVLLIMVNAALFLSIKNASLSNTSPTLGIDRRMTSKEAQDTAGKWANYIDTMGPTKAYEQFKSDVSKDLFVNQHILVHVFGNVLYERVGLEGLSVCDDKIVGGCYHGFFAKAIGDNGAELIENIGAECVKKPQLNNHNCAHGIGHGLQYYFGQLRLENALAHCQRSDWSMDLKGGCMSGVFMEYNLHNTDAPAAEKDAARKFDKKNPYAPCDKIQFEFKTPCYTELPRWWEIVLEDKDVYASISKLCSAIDTKVLRYHCYVGTGTIAPTTTDHDVNKTIALCKKMLTEDEGIPICLQSASWRFKVVPEQKKNAYKVCEVLPVAYRQTCALKSS